MSLEELLKLLLVILEPLQSQNHEKCFLSDRLLPPPQRTSRSSVVEESTAKVTVGAGEDWSVGEGDRRMMFIHGLNCPQEPDRRELRLEELAHRHFHTQTRTASRPWDFIECPPVIDFPGIVCLDNRSRRI